MTHNGGFHNPYEFDMALQPAAFAMLRKGIRIDRAKRQEFREELIPQIDDLYRTLDGITGVKLRAKKSISDARVKEWLYKIQGVKPRTKNKKLTSDEDALRAIMAEEEATIYKLKTEDAKLPHIQTFLAIKAILRIKEREKRLTYVEAEIDADGRMRCSETVGGTETGRFSHSGTPWDTGTNLATIPRILRSMFIPDDGFELAEFDLNRGESWIYSFLSNDPELIRIHITNGDFHSETAAAISSAFGAEYTLEDIIAKHKTDDRYYRIRFLGKKLNHATSYRMGPFRGAEVVNEESDETGITVVVSQVKTAQELWLGKYCMVEYWWRAIESKIREDRTLTTPFGRSRTFYEPYGSALWKEATAYVPQSTSVDYLNLGMLKVFNELVLKGYCELLHQQHDSILVQYKSEVRDEVVPLIRNAIESTELVINNHKITIPVEASYGTNNWRDLTAYKH